MAEQAGAGSATSVDSPHPVLDAGQGEPWYLVHSKPRAEAVALKNLLAQGYEAWFPLLKTLPARPSKAHPDGFAFAPLFPRYVFFRPAHAGQSIAPARYTTGVARLVAFGQAPALMAHAELSGLAQWVRNQHRQSAAQVLNLQPGTPVRIAQGPLAGLDALVGMAEHDRVVVLLELLGKQHRVELPLRAVRVGA